MSTLRLTGDGYIVREDDNLPSVVVVRPSEPSLTPEERTYLESLPIQDKMRIAYEGSSSKKSLGGPVPGIAAQIAFIGRGSNYTYTNNDGAGATPTPIVVRSSTSYTSSDVLLPAEVGDTIEFHIPGRINTSATSGLILSIWSCGGKEYRDVTTGVVGLQSTVGVLNIPAGNTLTLRGSAQYIVRAEDIDENGYVLFRLFGANTAAGPATHTVVNAAGNGSIFRWFGANLKKNPTHSASIKYFGNGVGTDLAFTTNTVAFTTLTAVDPTGGSDIIEKVTALDVIRIDLDMRYTASSNMRWVLGILKNGTWVRNAHSGFINFTTDGPLLDSSTGTQTIGATTVLRVRDTDISDDGTMRFRLYCCNTSGSGLLNHTIRGSDTLGGYSHMRLHNYGSAWRWAVTPTNAWESGPTTAAGSHQESGVWRDNKGRWNMIYTATPSDQMGWAWTDDLVGTNDLPWNPKWTKHPTPILGQGLGGVPGDYNRGSVFYENGVVYIYSRGYTGGGIGCCYGPDPTKLTNAGLVLPSNPPGFTTMENTKVLKGHDGAYWMFFEGNHTATAKWQMGLAKGPTPLGPFVHVAAPLTTLQGISSNNVTSQSVEIVYTGRGYICLHHSAPDGTSLQVPSMLWLSHSIDGINWRRRGIGADGTANSVMQPMYDVGHPQAADPSVAVQDGKAYIFCTAQENAPPPEKGGIAISNPDAWPLPFGI